MTEQKPTTMNNNSTNSTHQTGSTHPPQPNTPADPRGGSDNPALDSPLRGDQVEESGRERLKRLRVEVAGRVWIPDIWGQEELLKDWIDCNAFDASLVNNNIISARAALIQEVRATTANSGVVLRIENSC